MRSPAQLPGKEGTRSDSLTAWGVKEEDVTHGWGTVTKGTMLLSVTVATVPFLSFSFCGVCKTRTRSAGLLPEFLMGAGSRILGLSCTHGGQFLHTRRLKGRELRSVAEH